MVRIYNISARVPPFFCIFSEFRCWVWVDEMMGWMCGVGCHSLHRAEALPRAKTLG